MAEGTDLGVEKTYVIDTVGLISNEHKQELEKTARELSSTYPCEVRIVIVNDIRDYGYTVIEYFAYNMYLDYDFGYGQDKDCVLLTLSTTNREYDLRAWGDYAKGAFTLYGIDDILDNHILPEFKKDFYYTGFSKYLERAEVYFQMAANGKPFDRMTDPTIKRGILIWVTVAALVIAQAICKRWKKQMKTAEIAKTATNYIPQGGFRLLAQSDIFTYRTVTRVKIESDSSDGGASSGGSGDSSGRSGNY